MCRTRNRYLLCRTPIVSVANDSHAADKISRCQTEIEGRGAARWRAPPGRPEKAALDRYSGGPRKRPAARPKLRAAEQRAGGRPGAPRKSGLGPLFGGPEIAASPAISASELTKNRSSGM